MIAVPVAADNPLRDSSLAALLSVTLVSRAPPKTCVFSASCPDTQRGEEIGALSRGLESCPSVSLTGDFGPKNRRGAAGITLCGGEWDRR